MKERHIQYIALKVAGYSFARCAKCIEKCILKLANQESLASTNSMSNLICGGGGTLSQGAGHDGSFY